MATFPARHEDSAMDFHCDLAIRPSEVKSPAALWMESKLPNRRRDLEDSHLLGE